MSITNCGVNHFAVSVESMEESIDWYTRVLEFTLLVQGEIPNMDVKNAHMEGPGMVLELFEGDMRAYRK